MSKFIDLHTHSTCSDGTLSPTALVNHAADRKLTAIALTDHDTVSGVSEALAQGRIRGIEVVPGIEVSSNYSDTSLHILGYGIDHQDHNFVKFVIDLQQARHTRNLGILDRLQQMGIPIEQEELDHLAGDQVGRPHFAELLVKKGVVNTFQDAFTGYLKRGCPAFVEHARPQASEVIAQISSAGGLAMLAHPVCIDPSFASIPSLVGNLKQHGLDGLEAYYPSHSNKNTKALKQLADDHNLLVCGGTDFHGNNRSSTPLGGNKKTIRISSEILEKIKQRLDASG
ncbi:MAG: PHP domain-containing protein [Desulfobulbaceae bacterium]|nr:PHP domain-containing protein [Desulfobulbaceae bacterium]HIJ79980.1 PHP domain-containing protein [Deltaproteobacteria bacterium]